MTITVYLLMSCDGYASRSPKDPTQDMWGSVSDPVPRLPGHIHRQDQEVSRLMCKRTSKTTGLVTAVGEHLGCSKHQTFEDKTKVICRADNSWFRKIKEHMEIRTKRPSLNQNTGYQLPII